VAIVSVIPVANENALKGILKNYWYNTLLEMNSEYNLPYSQKRLEIRQNQA